VERTLLSAKCPTRINASDQTESPTEPRPHYTVAIKSKALPTQRTKWRYNSAARNQAHTIEL